MRKQQSKGLSILIGIGFIISPILGLFFGVCAIIQFENYFKPYLFAIIWGGLGIVIGYLFSKWIKSRLLWSYIKIRDYFQLTLYLIT